MRRVLISAYACEPGKGSEPGVGWNLVRRMTENHDVVVVTRENNRSAIEWELDRAPVPNLTVLYYDLPDWASFWKQGQRGIQLYYYLWQIGVYFFVKKIYQELRVDLIHHLTFGKYWAPSFLSLLPVPFIWGPLGGGESAPPSFMKTFGVRGIVYEFARSTARYLGELDPFVRTTARRCTIALASTPETAARLRKLKTRRVEEFPQMGVNLPGQRQTRSDGFIFASVGRLIHWKGYHLAIQAYAAADLPQAEFWVIGDGPERHNLEQLSRQLGVENRVRFLGSLSHHDTLDRLSQCHVLVHPSLHDQSPAVVLEAMSVGCPVICLDLGGPSLQVGDGAGIKVAAMSPDQCVGDLAMAMSDVARNKSLYRQLSQTALEHVKRSFLWESKAHALRSYYEEVLQAHKSR